MTGRLARFTLWLFPSRSRFHLHPHIYRRTEDHTQCTPEPSICMSGTKAARVFICSPRFLPLCSINNEGSRLTHSLKVLPSFSRDQHPLPPIQPFRLAVTFRSHCFLYPSTLQRPLCIFPVNLLYLCSPTKTHEGADVSPAIILWLLPPTLPISRVECSWRASALMDPAGVFCMFFPCTFFPPRALLSFGLDPFAELERAPPTLF